MTYHPAVQRALDQIRYENLPSKSIEFRHAPRVNATLHVVRRFRVRDLRTGSWRYGSGNLCTSGHPNINVVEGYDPTLKPCAECFKLAGLTTVISNRIVTNYRII